MSCICNWLMASAINGIVILVCFYTSSEMKLASYFVLNLTCVKTVFIAEPVDWC
jgi:hypothetical protein